MTTGHRILEPKNVFQPLSQRMSLLEKPPHGPDIGKKRLIDLINWLVIWISSKFFKPFCDPSRNIMEFRFGLPHPRVGRIPTDTTRRAEDLEKCLQQYLDARARGESYPQQARHVLIYLVFFCSKSSKIIYGAMCAVIQNWTMYTHTYWIILRDGRQSITREY